MAVNYFKLKVKGPGWNAEVRAVILTDPSSHLAIKNLFLSPDKLNPLRFHPSNVALLCVPCSIELDLLGTNFKLKDISIPSDIPGIQKDLLEGRASLLWVAGEIKDGGTVTCIEGGLYNLTQDSGTSSPLEKVLEVLEKLGLEKPDKLPANQRLAKLWVDAGGIGFRAKVPLPWQNQALSFPLRLSPSAKPKWLLSLRREAFDAAEKHLASQAWQALAKRLIPQEDNAPHFARLVVCKTQENVPLPHMYWTFVQDSAGTILGGELQMDAGALELLLSDASNGALDVASSLARLKPRQIVVKGQANNFQIDINQAVSSKEVLEYAYERAAKETLEVHTGTVGLPLAFDPIETAEAIRLDFDLPSPTWYPRAKDELPEAVEPQYLWMTLRLEDGWLQIPLPNLSAQIYASTGLHQAAALEKPNSETLQGAVIIGNSRLLLEGKRDGEHHWELVITGVADFHGLWSFDNQGIKTLNIQLVEPDFLLSGLLWRGKGRPTATDILPNLDDWIGGLSSIPLRLVRKGLPLRKPMANANDPKTPIDTFHDKLKALLEGAPPDDELTLNKANIPGLENDFKIHGLPVVLLDGNITKRSSQVWAIAPKESAIRGIIRKDDNELVFQLAGADEYPGFIQFELEELKVVWEKSVIHLQKWALKFAAQTELLNRLKEVKSFDEDPPLPIAWLRHPHLPMVQTLPLTQLQSIPNYPSPSRQLFPFQPKKQDWQLIASQDADHYWPKMNSPSLSPGMVLKGLPEVWPKELGLASLSLPGVYLVPQAGGNSADASYPGMAKRYRHDLPYTDEIHALTQLTQETSAEGTDSGDFIAETYACHLLCMNELAQLAALDAVEAFEHGGKEVVNLIQPYSWKVEVGIDLAAYPGTINFGAVDAVQGGKALAGIEGRFDVEGDLLKKNDASGKLQISLGSLQSIEGEGHSFTDQRGLQRQPTQLPEADKQVYLTPIELKGDGGFAKQLATCVAPLTLSVGEETWSIWFNCLPISIDDNAFDRQSIWKGILKDLGDDNYESQVNAPHAISRNTNPLLGYEWRLEPKVNDQTKACLLTKGLAFFPLTLERLEIKEGLVESLMIQGRLQLITQDIWKEQENNNNVVKLVFQRNASNLGESKLDLTELTLLTDGNSNGVLGEWPLANSGLGEVVPVLLFENLSWVADAKQVKLAYLKVRYHVLGRDWDFKAKANEIIFPNEGELNISFEPSSMDETSAKMGFKDIELKLDLNAGQHILQTMLSINISNPSSSSTPPPAQSITYTVRRGDSLWRIAKRFYGSGSKWPLIYAENKYIIGSNPNRIYPRQVLKIKLDGHNSPAPSPVSQKLTIFSADLPFDWPTQLGSKPRSHAITLFNKLEAQGGSPIQILTDAIQFQWSGLKPKDGNNPVELLPGMVINNEANSTTGVAALLFSTNKSQDGFKPESFLMETLLQCEWGDLLDSEHNGKILPASAGRLTVDYCAQFDFSSNNEAQGSLSFNGILEVTNLVSWPTDWLNDPQTLQLHVPKAQSAQYPVHSRHRIRILLNQADLPMELVKSGEREHCLLGLASPWQFPAVVEHLLVDVDAVTVEDVALPIPEPTLRNKRRWCAVQEVRLCEPKQFADFLKSTLDTGNTFDPKSKTEASLSRRPAGIFDKTIVDPIADAAELPAGNSYLLVEASAALWLKEQKLSESKKAVDLAYWTAGTVQAQPASLSDFMGENQEKWRLLPMPFLGRLLSSEDEKLMLVPNSAKTMDALRCDPILKLGANGATAPALLSLYFAHYKESPMMVKLSPLESPLVCHLPLLNTPTLDRAWQELLILSAESGTSEVENRNRQGGLEERLMFVGITETRASNTDRLSQTDVLSRMLNPTGMTPIGVLHWGSLGLLVIDQIADPAETGWHGVSLKLARLGEGLYPAASLLPYFDQQSQEQHRTYVPSPYASFQFAGSTKKADDSLATLVSTELVCLDASGRLAQTVSRIWFPINNAKELGIKNLEAISEENKAKIQQSLADQISDWAKQSMIRLAPHSSAAFVRQRELWQSQTQGFTHTRYGFSLINGLLDKTSYSLPLPIKPKTNMLRVREGQFGGFEAPKNRPKVFASIPPQAFTQPVTLMGGVTSWTRSALAVDTGYGVAHGIVGEPDGNQSWWHLLDYKIQYRAHGSGIAGLPPNYRAKAITSMLPAAPIHCLPNLPAESGSTSPAKYIQSVLPTNLRSYWVGARPGAFFALRNTLITQIANESLMLSGSIPAQYRMPRPLPLPRNSEEKKQFAVQTWESHFAPQKPFHLSNSPVDQVYLVNEETAIGLRLELVNPRYGKIDFDWDGKISFKVTTQGDMTGISWGLTLQLSIEGKIFSAKGELSENYQLNSQGETLTSVLSNLPNGSVLELQIKVDCKKALNLFHTENLVFPIRFTRKEIPPLPLIPVFVYFEDPEFNRQLSSSAYIESCIIETPADDNKFDTQTLTVAIDRREYNPDSILALRYDCVNSPSSTKSAPEPTVNLILGEQEIQLSELKEGQLITFQFREKFQSIKAGDKVLVKVTFENPDISLTFSVAIVGEPVLATPECAYALLKKEDDHVECVRFAWSPKASRVEYICAEDLQKGVVRRRAIFRWQDSIRSGRNVSYAIQKIASNGATAVLESVDFLNTPN